MELHVEDRKEYHAILIENKYYTGIHDNQLERYRQIFEEYYSDKSDNLKRNLHYALVTCLYDVDTHYAPLATTAKVNKFDIYHLFDLVDASLNYKETESDIYNELFLRNWL